MARVNTSLFGKPISKCPDQTPARPIIGDHSCFKAVIDLLLAAIYFQDLKT